MPPWGRSAAALGALLSAAAGAAALAAYAHVHYGVRTDGWTWAGAAFVLVVLAGYILGGGALLRRPGVAAPGLLGGLLVAASWAQFAGFTFTHWLNSVRAPSWPLLLAPVVVGAGATLWRGDPVAGRRAARLAAVSAALGVYLYGVLAVAVLGAAGNPHDDGWTDADVVSDRLNEQVVFYLLALPLVTATVGWAAAAATARLRPARTPATPRPAAPVAAAAAGHRTWFVLLLCAAVAASALLVGLTLLSSRR